MNLSIATQCVLEHIFLSQPSSREVIASAEAFVEMLGYHFTNEEISHAIADLISRQLIVEVTPEIATSILETLQSVHGPLFTISDAPHYSVTTSGGHARRELLSKESSTIKGGQGVVAIEHAQYFTPSETLIDELITTGAFSGTKLSVSNVFLAPNNECADGYIVDFLGAPGVQSHPISFQSMQSSVVQRELQQFTEQRSTPTNEHLTYKEAWVLFRLSGFCGSTAYQGVRRSESQPLLETGLVYELQKAESLQTRQRLLTTQSLLFAPIPKYKRHALSNAGMEAILGILHAMPRLKNHLLASRVVGEYVQQYFPTLDEALQAQKAAKESGNLVTCVERIGSWCYYWWDVHPEGARFSYWSSNTA